MRGRILISTFSVLALVAAMLLAGAWTPGPAATAATAAGSIPEARDLPYLDRVETASTAVPTAAGPVRADSAQESARTHGKAVAVSVATSNCNGCSATATTFQVVYNGGSDVAADNSATASSSCSGCSSSAVSVQLVVARHGRLTVNNRALALNTRCTRCSTTAAALQFVIAGGSRRDLSERAEALIAQLQRQLADRLNQARKASPQLRLAEPNAQRLADDTAARLQKIILPDLGAGTVQRAVDVKLG
ncbi:hypothetical protein KIH31_06845 [Paenarthrobacter sp. DKR-5]|uniref:hypothetical protein n=1 Tax=Paenarthrobacter sp. DKR-5 TaxID=2835535 RepID=UPI001BDDB0E3|nr:hypothetical protein [Paenarthrobacter sp. DKR-5]MBT1002316.1 hypothetical protein [Paenarthrobacter sp. DKR-5]